MVFCFFFFKQKTAYEMRISDWSSDVCSSDLVLSAALHVPLTVDSRWRELDFGQWDGKATGDIDSEALGRFWADPDCYPPPGGERWSAFVERVAAGLADLPPAPTLVVTQGGGVRCAAHLQMGRESVRERRCQDG